MTYLFLIALSLAYAGIAAFYRSDRFRSVCVRFWLDHICATDPYQEVSQ